MLNRYFLKIVRQLRYLPVYWIVFGFTGIFFIVYLSGPDNRHNQWKPKKSSVPEEPKDPEADKVFETLIQNDYARMVPGFGDWGEPAYLENIGGKRKDRVSVSQKRYAMNVIVSDRIMYNRSLPIASPLTCLSMKYDHDLPTVSVIIISRNEPWSPLLRTIHSVVNRSPAHLLKDLIIVDDASEYPELKYDFHGKMRYYIRTRLPDCVQYIQLEKRLGIVGSRLTGARAATGDVLMFLDAHSEVVDNWLPPLLFRIKQKRTVVVQPLIDDISWDHFEYSPFTSSVFFPYGIFTWAGMFEWKEMSTAEMNSRNDPTVPMKNAVLAGGIFAIDKEFFWAMGSYDEKMTQWGCENIEMSIRIWTCGGTMELIPCSRVGHVFRTQNPIDPASDPVNNSMIAHNINLLRVVKVWWDSYDRLLYQYRPSMIQYDYGDISEREALRKRLGCKSFRWYLKEVLRNKFVMDTEARYSGRFKSDSGQCLTFGGRLETAASPLVVNNCDKILTGKQYFAYSHRGELRREYLCLVPKPEMHVVPVKIVLDICLGTDRFKWRFIENERSYVNALTQQCLDSDSISGHITLQDCRRGKLSQRWTFIDNSTLNKK